MKNELEDKILAILEQHQVGVLTSVQGDYPHARYMTFLHDGLTFTHRLAKNYQRQKKYVETHMYPF